MNLIELRDKLADLRDQNEWAFDAQVKLDVGGLIVEITDVEFDKEKGEFFIVASRR